MFPKEEETGLVNSMTVSVTNKAFHEIHSILKLYLHGKKKSLKVGAGIVLLLEPTPNLCVSTMPDSPVMTGRLYDW